MISSKNHRRVAIRASASIIAIGALMGTLLPSSAVAATGGTRFGIVEAVVNPFYAPYPQAIKDAAADFGINPIPEANAPQQYDQSQENAVIDAFVAKGVDGLAIQPVDPAGGNVIVKRLVASGINVVGIAACDLMNKAGASVCIEANLYTHAYDATLKLIAAMHGKGNIVHLAGALAGNTTPPRIAGVKDAIKKFPKVHLLQLITDIDTPQLAQNAVKNLLAASKNKINGVIATAYNPSVAWANAMTKANNKKIPSVLTDTDPLVYKAVKAGYATGTMVSNAYAQAYLASASLKLMSEGCKFKDPKKYVYGIPYAFVGAKGVDTVTKTLMANAKKIGTTWKSDFWTCP